MARTLTVIGLSLALCACSKGGDKAAAGGGGGGGGGAPAKAPAKASSSGYSAGAVSDGGTVTGTIQYGGSETEGTVAVTKDTAVCGEGAVPARTLTVNGGKLAGAVVALDGVTAGKAWSGGSPTVDNVKCRFEPRVSVGQKGAELSARNSDAVLHNTHLYLKKGGRAKNLKNIALPNKDQVLKYKMKKAGLVDIRCDAHEWMQAWVWVSEHPYVAVTDAAGSFTMTDVPAGTYTAKIWHEKLGEASASVTVAAGGTATVAHTFQ